MTKMTKMTNCANQPGFEACKNCKLPCEARSIQIQLPPDTWQLLEELHDVGGPSPGEAIRLIVKVSIHQILAETFQQYVQIMGQRN